MGATRSTPVIQKRFARNATSLHRTLAMLLTQCYFTVAHATHPRKSRPHGKGQIMADT